MNLKQRVNAAWDRWGLFLGKNTVVYGDAPDIGGESDGHGWMCGRCRESGWCITGLPETKADAEAHASTHGGVRVYRYEG